MMKATTLARPTTCGRNPDDGAIVCGSARSKSALLVPIKVLIAAAIVGLGVGDVAPAGAGASVADFEGRWKDGTRNLVLDISKCSGGWCGVEVTGENACGRAALRIEERPARGGRLVGRLELAAETQPYSVSAELHQGQQGLRMLLKGQSGDKFQPWRRTYPFMAALVRVGDAQCRVDAKLS
ncbi:hypothetical protein [Bradyrhizobium liaoningense]|uniref:hypothetical protein n=1 Tax=Bradyrhizobium liaoningense TaxID=43992 RepID=UPI001BA5993C|nr:hypothetical protein [Bradyrhizobium liaoningense]MBR0857511.1 hypothetical protein [Bradyrhizobium liaoningense]